MDLKEIAEAYQLVYEKKKLDPVGKEDDDVDNDGDSDSSDEYLKKRRAAISKAMGKDGDDKDDDKDDDDNGDSKGLSKGQKKLPPQLQKAIAKKGKKSDKKESLDLMSAYHSMYEHHKKDEDGNTIPHEDEIEEGVDLSFVDELSEEELDTLVEEVVYDLLDEGIELDSIEGAFTEYLEEAVKITSGDNRPTDVRPGGEPEKDMTAEVKRRRAEKQKKNQERTENIKKSVTKTIRGLKAKAHGKIADYAGKRGLLPTKSAEAAKKPTRPSGKSKKYKTVGGEARKEADKAQYKIDKAKYDKVKSKKQSSGNIKVSMMGGGAKDTRSKLRSAVFKDVKDRVGKNVKKKTKAVIDAPRKASEGIRKAGGSVKSDMKKVGGSIKKGIGGLVNKGRDATAGVLYKIADKVKAEGRELDMFDTVTAYLIDEGLARDFDHAQRVMTTLDSALIEEVHAEQMQLLEAYTVTNADKKGNTPAYQNFKKGMKSKVTGKPMYKAADHMKNESLTDAYLKVYEEKSTGDKLKDIAKKKKAKYDAQPQAYKNNPAFGDESHHSNAKNK